jgi:ABC-type phosphate/phosphonate transport system substrate-binding protein
MSFRLIPALGLTAFALAALSAPARAADPAAAQKVSYVPTATAIAGPALLDKAPAASATERGTYVLSAPPHESAQAAAEVYAPLAEYLSRVTGKDVIFRHPANWIAYQAEMRKGAYDLVFDGPHFNAWRASHLQHNILVKAPGEHSFVVAVKKGNDKLRELKQLTGRAICGMSPPDLGSLTVLNEFDNPMRQPVIRNTAGWDKIYAAMQAGQCAAAILPARHLAKYDPQGTAARVLFKARAFPSQALSAGPHVSPADQAKIARALTSPEARLATARLRDSYALSGDFLPVAKDEYAGVAGILKDTWGYQ